MTEPNTPPACERCRHWVLVQVGLYPNWVTYCSRVKPERETRGSDSCDLYESGDLELVLLWPGAGRDA